MKELVSQIRPFREEGAGNCVPAREGGEQPVPGRAGRNEGEAHPMSPDNEQPVEPSVSSEREGCQDWRRQPGKPGNCPMAATPVTTTAGSAGAARVTRETWLKDESCGCGRKSPTAGASGSTASLEPAVAAVGADHSSDEGGNDAG